MIKQIAAIRIDFGLTSGLLATTLQGRHISGKPVDEYDSNAVFLRASVANITWLRDANHIDVKLQP
jgi:hypothetical protein